MLKYLRIAVTVLSLTACVLLIALWVRSYRWSDGITVGGRIVVASREGRLLINESLVAERPLDLLASPLRIRIATDYGLIFWSIRSDTASPAGVGTAIPDWLFVAFTATLAALPWVKRRFSLRTLLIATTLVAVVLGIIIAA